MSVVIIDDFSEEASHGYMVKSTLSDYYDGDIHIIDLESGSVAREKIENALDEVYENIEDGSWNDVSSVNVSFGGSAARNPFYAENAGFEVHVQQLFSKNADVSFSSGNTGNIFSGPSQISTSPFSWCVGAIEDGNITEYTQHHPSITDGFANGENEEYSVCGTSFSSPRIAGSIATIKEKFDLTVAEARTAYETTADHFVADHKFHSGTNYYKLNYEELENLNGPVEIESKQKIDAAYEIFLQRQPDKEGWDYWADKFNFSNDDGLVLDSFLDGAVSNDDMFNYEVPVIEYVQAHYHLFLGREADMAGLEYWVDEYTDERFSNMEDFTEKFLDGAVDEEIQYLGIVDKYMNISEDYFG